jgi:endonuclease/exonuclease/phosphatase family metal-dependent hydrolase
VRVLILNLWGRRGDWPSRRRVLGAGLRQLAPDLIAFQEAVVNDDYDQVQDLLGSELPHVFHQRSREPPTDDPDVEPGQGISIASRWPLVRTHELDLHLTPRTADFACASLVADIDAPTGRVLFANHLPSWQKHLEYERELQTVLLARYLEHVAPDSSVSVLTAGDLDAEPDAASIRFWRGRQSLDGVSVCYHDAWHSVHPGEPGHTIRADNPLLKGRAYAAKRIDYLLVRCDERGEPSLTIDTCEIAFGKPVDGVWASDHCGVMADLSPR